MATSIPGRFEGAPRFGPWVTRERLLKAFERSAPSGIVLSAPAGYGKTYLAAQYASSGPFELVVWVACEGRVLTCDALISTLVDKMLAHESLQDLRAESLCDVRTVSDGLGIVRHAFRCGLLPDATCFVLDDVRLAEAEDSLLLLLSILESESSQSALLLTTRESASDAIAVHRRLLVVGPDSLRMDILESRRVLAALCDCDLGETDVQELLELSCGHAAFLSVLARRAALGVEPRLRGSVDLSALLMSLAVEQLDSEESELLYALALLGSVSQSDARILSLPSEADKLERIAECLPLVDRVCSVDSGVVLAAHTIAQEVFRKPEFAERQSIDPQRMRVIRNECMAVLEHRSEYGRAIEILLRESDASHLCDWLETHGQDASDAGFRPSVKSAIEALSPDELLDRPRVLLLSAEVDMDSLFRSESLAKAAAVRDLALCAGDYETYADALMLIANHHVDDSAPLRAIEPLETLLALPEETVGEERRVAATAYLHTFLLMTFDLPAVNEYGRSVQRLLERGTHTIETRARLLAQLGTTAGLIGRYDVALSYLADAKAMTPVSARLRALILGNYGSALHQVGRTEYAAEVLDEALRATENCGLDLYHVLHQSTAAGATFSVSALESALESVMECASVLAEAGDHTAEAQIRYSLAAMLRSAGRTAESLIEIEHMHERSITQESPYLKHCADVELAANLLAMNDLEGASERAGRVRAATLDGHVPTLSLRADLVLAEVSRRRGRLDEALTRLFDQQDYILSENANWVAAIYIRAFPHLLGLTARVLGVDRIPMHLLKLVIGHHAEDSLSAARDLLEESEWRLLATRLLGEKDSASRISALEQAPMCRVRMFGGFDITVGERKVQDKEWSKRKGRVLFAALVLRQGREVPREQLFEQLWPEMDAARARNNFYVIWSSMKHVLSPEADKNTPCPYVESAGGVCRSVPELVWSDAQEFDTLIREARRAEVSSRSEGALEAYERLAELYRGELLPGDIYEDAFADARDRYRQDLGDAMLRAQALMLERGDTAGALRLVRAGIAADPVREDLYQAALRLQIDSGQRSAAVETYLSCRSRLIDELGLDPCVDTVRLYEQVLAMEDAPQRDGIR
jgi:DNA-binding SARP family transcriptional activator/ATP/maltotriose-dependent transcriptional regulator MalT